MRPNHENKPLSIRRNGWFPDYTINANYFARTGAIVFSDIKVAFPGEHDATVWEKTGILHLGRAKPARLSFRQRNLLQRALEVVNS